MKSTKATAKLNAKFESIAREHLFIETLEERRRDHLDFHDVGVVGLKKALAAAYEAGLASAQANCTTDLDEAIRNHLSPHAVALMASKLSVTIAKGEDGLKAEEAHAWVVKQLVDMLGAKEYEALCGEMDI